MDRASLVAKPGFWGVQASVVADVGAVVATLVSRAQAQ